MKLLKPNWVTHDGYPIFSIDIHPDGSRFATGGQGEGDSGRVVVWNMGPVIDEETEGKENVPKYLSRMDNHLNCVNCVRWSPEGKYLASAGDDKVIMIWQIARYNNPSSTANNNSFINSSFGNNVEVWRCVATLRGHDGDILDLSWSLTDPYLASCSIDNHVIVWNTSKWHDIVTRITGHTGLVKGVSFDPVGKFMASQSDDKSLKIWRTSDWKEEHCLTDPFVDCGGTTHVLRLNWSPDGQVLVSAHAMNNQGSVAQIIERDGWVSERDYVGHRKAITCVRFNRHLFSTKLKTSKKEKEVNYSCLAMGSRDRTVSVWTTASQRPVVVLHDLFDNSIMDMSWSKCGRILFVCSWDGSVACLNFEGRELGRHLTDTETTLHMEKLYGKSTKHMTSNLNLLAEDVEFIKAREENMANNKTHNRNIIGSSNDQMTPIKTNGHAVHDIIHDNRSMNDSRSSTGSRLMKGPIDKQIEIKLSNGKRRITPLYIPPPIDLDGIPIPFSGTQVTTFSTSEESRSKIPIEKRDSNLSPAKDELPQQLLAERPVQPKLNHDTVIIKQEPRATSSPASSPVSHEKNSVQGAKRKVSESTAIPPVLKKKPQKDPPVKNVSKQPPPLTPAPSVVSSQELVAGQVSKKIHKHHHAHSEKSLDKKARITLSPLSLERITKHGIEVSDPTSKLQNHCIEKENNVGNSRMCAVRLQDGEGNRVWEVILTNVINAVTATESFTGVSCSDNTLSVYTTSTGRRLYSPFLLSSPTSLMTSSKSLLMIITMDCKISLFDFSVPKTIIKNESMRSLFMEGKILRTDVSIVKAIINSKGAPVISLSNKKSFVFNLSFSLWSEISEPSDLMIFSSDVKHPPGSRSDTLNNPLAAVQSIHRSSRHSSSGSYSSNTALQANSTISFLDQQLTSALAMGSPREYQHWLLSLTQVLTNESREVRLRELCESFIGPVFCCNADWKDSEILGLKKRDLLSRVLQIMTSNLRLQRLYAEFKEQLSLVQELETPSITDSTNANEKSQNEAQAVMDTS